MASRLRLLRIDSVAMITRATTRSSPGPFRVPGGAAQQGEIGDPVSPAAAQPRPQASCALTLGIVLRPRSGRQALAPWGRAPLRPLHHRYRIRQLGGRRTLRRAVGGDHRAGRLRRNLPERRLHPEQDVRLPGRSGPGARASRPRSGSTSSWSASAGPTSGTGSSAGSTPTRRAVGGTGSRAATSTVFSRRCQFVGPRRIQVGTDGDHRRPDRDRRRQPAGGPGHPRAGLGAVPHLRHGHAAGRAAGSTGHPRRRVHRRRVRRTCSPRSAPR